MRILSIADLRARTIPTPSGRAGVARTLAAMRACVNAGRVNPAIRAAAINIVQFEGNKDYTAEAQALFEYVRDHIRYVRDVLNVETVSTAVRTLQTEAGDCDDQCVLLASLLESIGHPTRFVAAGYSAPGEFTHVYLHTWAGGRWIDCDPTEPHYFGWAPPNPRALLIERV